MEYLCNECKYIWKIFHWLVFNSNFIEETLTCIINSDIVYTCSFHQVSMNLTDFKTETFFYIIKI